MTVAAFRILIVDDDPRFRRALHLALGARGYKVDDAAGAMEALALVAIKTPDLILLDWHLPEIDGIETCRALRALSPAPVIMSSGNRSNSREIALAAGATDYLAKPFSIDELLARIESALKL
ncbi:MAG TPA: response regulator transcription factor [Bryobacteraceae bacterium]|jgi:two-component system KDP operon response regulator KdpE